jgi:hypothetical protein
LVAAVAGLRGHRRRGLVISGAPVLSLPPLVLDLAVATSMAVGLLCAVSQLSR